MSTPTPRSATSRVRVTATAPPVEGCQQSVQKVKVRVYKSSNDLAYRVESSHPLPPSNVVKGFLSKRDQDAIRLWYYDGIGLNGLIGIVQPTSVKPAAWAEAIAQATASMLSMTPEATSELSMVSEGGYLSLGNAIFKLTPTDFITTGSKALPALRRTVMDSARASADAILVAANTRADTIRQGAESHRSRVAAETEQVRIRHTAMQRDLASNAPDWAKSANIPIRYMNTGLPSIRVEWGMWLNIKLKKFEWEQGRWVGTDLNATYINTRYTWHGINLHQRGVRMLVWGRFPTIQTEDELRIVFRQITCDDNTRWLPHMADHACMVPGDLPLTFASYRDYTRLRDTLERVHCEVNLGSLLTYPGPAAVGGPDTGWYRELDRFIPPQLASIWSSLATGRGIHNLLAERITDGSLIGFESHDLTAAEPLTMRATDLSAGMTPYHAILDDILGIGDVVANEAPQGVTNVATNAPNPTPAPAAATPDPTT